MLQQRQRDIWFAELGRGQAICEVIRWRTYDGELKQIKPLP
jgi:hypothetical protein